MSETADPQWDGGERRHDPRWQNNVDLAIAELRRGQELNARAVETNTRITEEGLRDLNRKVDAIETATKPVTEAIQTMQAGVRVLGHVGRIVTFFVKYWYVWIGGWWFFETFITGKGLAAALEAFWRGAAPPPK